MILIPFVIVVLFLVVPLLGFHCGLVLKGRNTHEHVTGKFNLQRPNPFDLGAVSNCMTRNQDHLDYHLENKHK